MLYDLHIHSSNFSDGEMTLDEIVAIAQQKGIQAGIADHWIHGMTAAEELERYLDTLDRYPVYKGLEVSLGHSLEVPSELVSRFDYIIGSLHDIELNGERLPFGLHHYFLHLLGDNPDYQGADPFWEPSLLETMLDIFLKAIETQPIKILGHSTLLPPLFMKDPEKILPRNWSERLISALVGKGIAIEISGAWRLPHREFLQRALEMGANFSFGSDAHRAWMVGEIDYPIRMAKELEIPEERIYRPSRTL